MGVIKEKGLGESLLIGTASTRLAFRIGNKVITKAMLSQEVLDLIAAGGSGTDSSVVTTKVIDLSERMISPNNIVSDYEVKTYLFVYNGYDRVSGIARVVEPETNDRYLLFKVCYADSTKCYIHYIAYTTTASITQEANWTFSKIITESDDLYPWAMTVFGDAYVDYENNILSLGDNVKYALTRSTDDTIYSYSYGVPTITSFFYEDILPYSGGSVTPALSFRQIVTITTTTAGSSTTTTTNIIGTYSSVNGTLAIRYSSGASYANNTSISFVRSSSVVLNNAGVSSTTGIVSAGESPYTETKNVISVNATITINGIVSSAVTATVSQEAAPQTGVPTITATPSSLAYSGTVGTPITKNIVVNGSSLTGDITVTYSGDSTFAVSTTTISASSEFPVNLPVVYTPNSASQYRYDTGTVTLSSPDASSVSVTLSGTGVAAIVSVTGVTLDPTSATLTEGSTLQLTATVTPSDATDPDIEWSSSDESIATVSDSGLVTAVSEGSVTITAQSVSNSSCAAECTITVEANTNTYFYAGHISSGSDGSGSKSEFAALSDSTLLSYLESSPYTVQDGTEATSTKCGTALDDTYYETTIAAQGVVFFLAVPSDVDIAEVDLFSVSMYSPSDIYDDSVWFYLHSAVTIDGVSYNIYGLKNESLVGDTFYIYAK